MTEQEAIEIMEEVKALDDSLYAYDPAYMEALEIVISASKEVQRYRKIGTAEECREAVEKQKPKKPTWKNGRSIICKDYEDGHGEVEENKWADWVCPKCGWFVGEQYIPRRHNQRKNNYCSKCGQAIDWLGSSRKAGSNET